MADRFPIILNTSANQLQEMPAGDSLDISGAAVKANLVDSLSVVGTGVSVAGIVTATSFVGSGANLSGIDISAVKDSGGNVKIQAEASGAIYTGIHTFGSTTSFTNGVFNGTVTSTGAVVNGDSDLNGDIDVEGDLDVDGHTNLDNVNIAGVTTTTDNIRIDADNKKLQIGDGQDIEVYHDGTYSYIQSQGTLFIDATGDINFRNPNTGEYKAAFNNNGPCALNFNNSAKITTTNTGINVTGNVVGDGLTIDGDSDLNGDLDVDGHTNLDNVSVAGFTTITQDLNVDGHTNLDNVSVAGVSTFANDVIFDNALKILYDKSNSFFRFGDNVKAGFGNNGDLEIYHNATNSYIDNNRGDLYLQTTGSGDDILIESADDIVLNVNGSNYGIYIAGGAQTELYWNAAKRLATNNLGVDIFGGSNYANLWLYTDDGNKRGGIYADNSELVGLVDDQNHFLAFGAKNGAFYLRYDQSTKLETTTTGVTITGTAVAGALDIGGDIDVDGHTNLDNLSVAGVTTFTGAINGSSAAFSGNATITGNLSVGGVLTYEDVKNVDSIGVATARTGLKVLAGGANVVGVVTASNGIFVPDNQVIHLGNVSGTGDLQIYHDTSHSYVKDVGTGDLILQTQGGHVAIKYGSDTMALFQPSNKAELYYANSAKLATTNTGVTVTGNIAVSGTVDGVDIASFKTSFDNLSTDLVNDTSPQLGADLDTNGFDINFDANKYLTFANTSSAGQIYHTGSHFYVWNGTGNTQIHADQIFLKSTTGNENMLRGVLNGTVELYYNASKKIETTNTGVTVTGTLVADQVGVQDNEYVYVGSSSDIAIYHDANGSIHGTNAVSYIKCQGVHDNILDIFTVNAAGKIRLKSNNLAETMLVANGNGSVDLYHNNSKKLETTSSGITVTGNATATTFIGALTGTASGNTTITNNADNRVVTGGSGNALNGEANLTYNGSNLQFNTTANGHAVILKSTGNYYTKLQFDSNRSAANDVLTIIDFKWNGDTVADILAVAGSDTSNKDDGQLKFRTSPSQGAITERVRIEQNGQIGIGGISPRTINSHAPQIQISGDNYSDATVSIINNANDNNGAYLFLGKQRSGSAGGSTIIQSNDLIGQIRFSGADGTDLENPMAYIECRADGTPGSNDVPGRLMFYTTPDGTGSPQVRMTIKNNGRVGINESDPSEMLYVAGNIYATGNVTAYSDIRVKENVKEISNALEAVDKIRGVSYTRKDTKEDTLGVSAQEVETMFPELVVEDNHGMKSVNYNGLVGVLFSAVKELSTKLKEIENK